MNAVAANPSAVFQARDIRFGYAREAAVLDGIDLTIRPGKITMILGRSGCGKTTLLKVLIGLLEAQGSVGNPSQLRTAYIPQTLGLVRSRTAMENVLSGALGRVSALRGFLSIFPASILSEAKEIVEHLGLSKLADRRVASLSGGERQRVAIARALLVKPDLIFADEFVSQLDAVTAQEILKDMRELSRRGVGFVVTTHDPELAVQHADEVAVMRKGRLVAVNLAVNRGTEEIMELLK